MNKRKNNLIKVRVKLPDSVPTSFYKKTAKMVVETYDLPDLSIATYATSKHAVRRKQTYVQRILRDASAAIKRDFE